MNVKKIPIDIIFSYKDKIPFTKQNELFFNKLASSMNVSINTNSTKKEIILNNDKWCRKIFLSDDEKKKKKINSYLNMCSKSNYEKISNDILTIKIENCNQLEYLIDILIQKYRFDYNLNIWDIFIKNLIFKNVNKWKFDDIYPAKRLLNKINNILNEITNSDYQNKMQNYFQNDIELFYKSKNINNGLMKLISLIFSYKLISKYSITEILRDFTLNISQFHKLELGITLISYIYNFVNKEEQTKFIEYFNLFLKEETLNIKVKFMILDFFDKNTEAKNDEVIKKHEESESNDEIIELIIRNNIKSYLENNYTDFKITPNIKYKLNKVVYYFILYMIENDNSKEKVNKLFINLIESRVLKTNTLKYGFIELLQDYEEYQYDNININNTINYVLRELLNNKNLSTDNINFIFSKVNNDIKNKINFKF